MKLFEEKGPANTQAVVDLAVEAARRRKIQHLVLATRTGATTRHFLPYFREFQLVAVTHAFGFAGPGMNEMAAGVRAELEGAGFRLVTAAHVLSGAERGLSTQFGGVYPVEIVANTLRMFGQGLKVGVEISIMALDAGAIPHGRDTIAIGGSNEGADTAIVIRPAHANAMLETRIVEIICMPRQ